MTGERPRPRPWRALWLAAELLTAAGAIAWWWSARDDGAPRIEPRPSRATAERSVAALPTAPEAERTREEVALRPVGALPAAAFVVPASPLLEPDRVVVVRGVVVAAEGGAPIEGASVFIHRSAGARVDTDEQGRYELRIEGGIPDSMGVYVNADGYVYGHVVAVIAPEATEVRVDFRLRRGFSAVVAVVRAVDGAPIPFAHVVLGEAGLPLDMTPFDGQTDSQGRWSVEEVCDLGSHDLCVIAEAEGFAPRRFEPLALPDGSDRLELRCELSPTRRLSGIVVAAGGGPIAGANVEVLSLHRDYADGGDEARTDDAGRFTVEARGIPEELTSLLVGAEGWQPRVVDRPWSSGGSVTVVLTEPCPPWRLRVVDAATGKALTSCEVSLGYMSDLWSDLDEAFAVQLDDGSFEVSQARVPEGRAATIWISADGYAGRAIEAAPSRDVGGTAPVVIELDRELVIRGRVLDSSSQVAVEEALVLVLVDSIPEGAAGLEWFSDELNDETGSSGQYEITLPVSVARAAGKCSFIVSHDRRRFALGRLDLRAQLDRIAPGEPAVITLDLPIDASPRSLGDRR